MNSNMNSEYPTEEQLEKITAWPALEFYGLMEYIKPIWMYADSNYWTKENGEYHISTGGWSGNEEIIEAMQQNYIWWATFWQSAERGGHFKFRDTRGER